MLPLLPLCLASPLQLHCAAVGAMLVLLAEVSFHSKVIQMPLYGIICSSDTKYVTSQEMLVALYLSGARNSFLHYCML